MDLYWLGCDHKNGFSLKMKLSSLHITTILAKPSPSVESSPCYVYANFSKVKLINRFIESHAKTPFPQPNQKALLKFILSV